MSKLKIKALLYIVVLLAVVGYANFAKASNGNLNDYIVSPQNSPIFTGTIRTYQKEINALLWGQNTPKKAYLKYNDWLNKLGELENCPITGMVDSNGKKSYGKYCFQKDTFLEVVKKHREEYKLLPYAEENELVNWLSDEEFQKELIAILIDEESDLVKGKPRYSYRWFTSIHIKKLGLAK